VECGGHAAAASSTGGHAAPSRGMAALLKAAVINASALATAATV